MIRSDAISIFFDVLAVSELLFFTTFGGALFTGSVVAVLLLLAAVSLDRFTHKGDEELDAVDESDLTKIGVYSLSAVAIFYALGTFVPAIPPQYKPVLAVGQLTVVSLNGLFVVQIAVSESEFFHRFLTNLFVGRLSYLGYPLVGFVGMVYHYNVYGDSTNDLLIVFGAFTALAYIAWTTGRVSVVILAHVLNNALASGLLSIGSIGAGFGVDLPTLAFGGFVLCVTVINRLHSISRRMPHV